MMHSSMSHKYRDTIWYSVTWILHITILNRNIIEVYMVDFEWFSSFPCNRSVIDAAPDLIKVGTPNATHWVCQQQVSWQFIRWDIGKDCRKPWIFIYSQTSNTEHTVCLQCNMFIYLLNVKCFVCKDTLTNTWTNTSEYIPIPYQHSHNEDHFDSVGSWLTLTQQLLFVLAGAHHCQNLTSATGCQWIVPNMEVNYTNTYKYRKGVNL